MSTEDEEEDDDDVRPEGWTCHEDHEPHPCPYAEEINDDHDQEYCTCCPVCEQHCQDSI